MTDQMTLAGLLIFAPVILVAIAATISETLRERRTMRRERVKF